MSPLQRAFRGKTVLVTGHTGFKGGWLSLWLKALGAKVVGFSLPAEGRPNFFETAGVADGMVSLVGDVRDRVAVEGVFREHQPEVVFHLAAQALVRFSYRQPIPTFATNVLGTAHVLEAARATPSVRAAVAVTSDKCYENPEDGVPRVESDPMGGHDPYSASKGAAELVISSYLRSFFQERGIGLAAARAGNVIGGGDWAEDRIVPDCVRALAEGKPVVIRQPRAVRPWQHVLEPASGYLWLAARLLEEAARYSGGWNFGPETRASVTVKELAKDLVSEWGAPPEVLRESPDGKALHEAASLALDPSKAKKELGWRAAYSVRDAVRSSVAWYKASLEAGFDGAEFSLSQIAEYTAKAASLGLPWAGKSERKAARTA